MNESRRPHLTELAALALFCGLEAVLGWRVAAAAQSPAAWLWIGLAWPLAWLATDLVSGLVHWACDTCLEEETPVLGGALIFPFREHHRDPLLMTRRPWYELNHSNCLAILPFLIVGVWRGGPQTLELSSIALYAWLFWFGLGCYLTNTFHGWAHHPRPPRIARLLQRLQLAIPPARHRSHHARGVGAYCVTTGWANPALDRLRVWLAIEALLGAVAPGLLTRARPTAHNLRREPS